MKLIVYIQKNNFLDVPSKPDPNENRMTYTWPDKSGDFEIYYKKFNCNYKNSQCEECSCVFDTLKTTFIIPKNSNISSNSKVPLWNGRQSLLGV